MSWRILIAGLILYHAEVAKHMVAMKGRTHNLYYLSQIHKCYIFYTTELHND